MSQYASFLRISGFDSDKSKILINGFKNGFDIGYRGPVNRVDVAANIPITVGSHEDMWQKIMKEVSLGRTAGPFTKSPYKFFMQSPIGLVPKAGGQTRMIFHLSYDFGPEWHQKSLNFHTPEELCSVKYNDLDFAVKTCLKLCPARWQDLINADKKTIDENQIFFAKSDLRSAFKILPIQPSQRCFLIYKARHPGSQRFYWFVEKTLPFGASVSCAKFQLFSESLKHIIEYVTGNFYQVTNYLDDFLFIERSQERVNWMVRQFLIVCQRIGCPVALDKTEWGDSSMVFLGILLDGGRHCLALPVDKVRKAKNMLKWMLDCKKATIKEIQRLSGTLNFLCKAIVPGRTFTRTMYDKLKLTTSDGKPLKQYHHVSINRTFKEDCQVWSYFLENASRLELCRPFVDIEEKTHAVHLRFATDSSANPELGMGGVFDNHWFSQKWDKRFIQENNPSINYLELYALVTALVMWGDDKRLSNSRVIILNDNKGVKFMVNNMTGKCQHSMKLIRMLALLNLKHNRRVFVEYLPSKSNFLADALSRLDFAKFWRLAPNRTNAYPDHVPELMWPMDKRW